MAKRIALLDIDPSKYYLMHRNVHGLGNTLWPCKVLCKETHGWLRGFTHLSNDGKKIWLLPLGYKHEVEIREVEHGTVSRFEIPNFGYQYFPKGQKVGGEIFNTMSECKASIEAE